MKWKLFIIIGILFSACNKPKNLCPEYGLLIGKWGNQIGDDKVQVEFFKNGRIDLKSSIQRRKIFRSIKCSVSEYAFQKNWQSMRFEDKNKRNSDLYLYFNPAVDSIKIFTGDNIENFTYVNNNAYGENYLLRIK